MHLYNSISYFFTKKVRSILLLVLFNLIFLFKKDDHFGGLHNNASDDEDNNIHVNSSVTDILSDYILGIIIK